MYLGQLLLVPASDSEAYGAQSEFATDSAAPKFGSTRSGGELLLTMPSLEGGSERRAPWPAAAAPQPPSKWSFGKVRNLLLFLFLAAGLLLVATNHPLRSDPAELLNRKQPFGVAFESTLRPASEVRITAEEVGTVAEMFVKVGDSVRPGQALLRMDDSEATQSLDQARMERDTAHENLSKFQLADATARLAMTQRSEQAVPTRQWRDSPERAQAAYDLAQTNYDRAKALFDAGVIAQQEMDARKTELRMAQDDLDNAKALASVSTKLDERQSRQASLQVKLTQQELQQQLRQADLKYEEAQQRLDATIVRATTRGVVADLAVRIGDRVPGGTILVKLAQLDRMIAEVPVAARMVSQLRLGQPALVELPAQPEHPVPGKIRTISPLPSENMTHMVEVEFDNPTLKLLAGQPAEVRFVAP
jgi:multidrug resistance efflux pump